MYCLLQLVLKIHRKARSMYKSNLKGSRSQTITKGYQGTYDDFLEAKTKWSFRSRYLGPVLINNNSPFIGQVCTTEYSILNQLHVSVCPFLAVFGVKDSNKRIYSFC